MPSISVDQLTPVQGEDNYTYVTEASDIGLRPGEWPATIETKMGNGQPFRKLAVARDEEGDVTFVTYAQLLGLYRVHIYND